MFQRRNVAQLHANHQHSVHISTNSSPSKHTVHCGTNAPDQAVARAIERSTACVQIDVGFEADGTTFGFCMEAASSRATICFWVTKQTPGWVTWLKTQDAGSTPKSTTQAPYRSSHNVRRLDVDSGRNCTRSRVWYQMPSTNEDLFGDFCLQNL